MADLMIPTEFGLSEERKMMLDMLKKFKEKECPKDKIGEWDEENHFPVDVWKKLGDEGILGACFPEEFGGTGGNIIDETLITEEISNSFSAMGLAYLTGVCFGGMSILHYGTAGAERVLSAEADRRRLELRPFADRARRRYRHPRRFEVPCG